MAAQTAKDRSQFGKGDVRGAIAPESANNAKEGGVLMPTLLFGVPGSSAMALLLASLLIFGSVFTATAARYRPSISRHMAPMPKTAHP